MTIPEGHIERAILFIRKQKVMLDADLAWLYGVSVGRLNEAVRRNINRFPADFMFQLTKEEFVELKNQTGWVNLKSQIAISSSGWGGRRHPSVDGPAPTRKKRKSASWSGKGGRRTVPSPSMGES
jgi:hypothetical protein